MIHRDTQCLPISWRRKWRKFKCSNIIFNLLLVMVANLIDQYREYEILWNSIKIRGILHFRLQFFRSWHIRLCPIQLANFNGHFIPFRLHICFESTLFQPHLVYYRVRFNENCRFTHSFTLSLSLLLLLSLFHFKLKQTSSPLITKCESNAKEDIHSFNMLPSFNIIIRLLKITTFTRITGTGKQQRMNISSKKT